MSKVPQSRILRVLRLIFLITSASLMSACGILDYSNEKTVSSSLVEYLYPKGLKNDLIAGRNSPSHLPKISLPVKVGIAFVPTYANFNSSISQKSQTELLDKAKQHFSKYDFVQKIEVIPSNYLQAGGGFGNLEQVARLFDVELMALVSYDQLQKSYARDSSFMYLTIIGAYAFKGDANETQTFVDTAVFDVASRTLLFRAPGTHRNSKNSTAVDKHRISDKLSVQGFESAVAVMQLNLDAELGRFRKRVENGEMVQISYKGNYSGGGSMDWIFLLMLLMVLAGIRSGVKFRKNLLKPRVTMQG